MPGGGSKGVGCVVVGEGVSGGGLAVKTIASAPSDVGAKQVSTTHLMMVGERRHMSLFTPPGKRTRKGGGGGGRDRMG